MKYLLIFIFCISGNISLLQAQFFEKLKNRVQNKIEQNINRKAENKVDKIFEKKTKESKRNTPTSNGSNKNTLTGSYNFQNGLTISMTSENNDTTEIEIYFSKSNSELFCFSPSNTEMEGQKVYCLISESSTVTLMETSGMKIKINNKQNFKLPSEDYTITNNYDIKRTGKFKTILGYRCEEHKYTNQDSKTISMYVTSQKVPVSGTFIPFLGMAKNSPIKGFVMQIEAISKKEKHTIEVTDFSQNANLNLNTNEYRSMF